jgi:hypothetical protein
VNATNGVITGLFSGTCILMRDQKTTGRVLARSVSDKVQQVPTVIAKATFYIYQEMFTTEDILAYGTEQYNMGFTTGFIIGLSLYGAAVIIFSL